MTRLIALTSLCFAVAGCASMKTYRTPLTPAEGRLIAPALVATSESMGLRSFSGLDGALTYLEDGTMLSWQVSADGREFVLLIDLPGGVPEHERDVRWREAKVRADQIWQLATESRQQSNVGASVLVPGPGAAGADSSPR